jgi:hypothetical protein
LFAIALRTMTAQPSRVLAVLILTLCGGLACVASWAALKPTGGFFPLAPEDRQPAGGPLNPRNPPAERARAYRETVVQTTIVGACCGALLGLGMGIAVRSWLGAVIGVAAGAVLTAGFGAAGGLAVVKAIHDLPQFEVPYADLGAGTGRALVAHAVLWSVLSVGIALSAGLATRRAANIPRALVAGLLAACVGAVLLQVLGTALFMAAKTEFAVPRENPLNLVRLLWVGGWSVTYGLALGRVLALGPAGAVTSSASAPPGGPAAGTAVASPPGSTRTP